MANHATDHITYFLQIEQRLINDLSALRQWPNLKVAFDGDWVWITNFELYQIESTEVKAIPYKNLFYQKGEKLYPYNSLLPERNASSLLWTPIERAIPVTISNYNHNFFGLEQQLNIRLVDSDTPREACALLVPLKTLEQYVVNAPEVRLSKLQWCIINNKEAFVIGSPLLPIPGNTYWNNGDQMIPTGYQFELDIIANEINDFLSPKGDIFIVWNTDNSYSSIDKRQLISLTISSIKRSMLDIELQQNLMS